MATRKLLFEDKIQPKKYPPHTHLFPSTPVAAHLLHAVQTGTPSMCGFTGPLQCCFSHSIRSVNSIVTGVWSRSKINRAFASHGVISLFPSPQSARAWNGSGRISGNTEMFERTWGCGTVSSERTEDSFRAGPFDSNARAGMTGTGGSNRLSMSMVVSPPYAGAAWPVRTPFESMLGGTQRELPKCDCGIANGSI